MIKEYETTVSKIIYYDKNKKKTNFWRISVKFHLLVPLNNNKLFIIRYCGVKVMWPSVPLNQTLNKLRSLNVHSSHSYNVFH